MSDPVDPSPYAPPDLTSYPEKLRREPTTEVDRRLASWWWLVPLSMFAISIFLPTWEERGRHVHLIVDGKIAGFLASFAVACTIGSINSFRQARVAREDGDVLRNHGRTALGTIAACLAVLFYLYSAMLFLPFIL